MTPKKERNHAQPTADKIEKLTPQILKYYSLHPDEQEWLYPLLSKATRTASDILEACSDKPRGYKKIGQICELHPNTVKQYLYALSNGGYDSAWTVALAGFPKNLAERAA